MSTQSCEIQPYAYVADSPVEPYQPSWSMNLGYYQDSTEDLTPQYDNHAFESGEYGGMASIFWSSSYPEQVEVYEQSYGDEYVSLEQNFQSNWNAFSEDTSGITKLVDIDVLRHLRDGVKGSFNEDKFAPYIGFSCLRKYLESELQKRYKEAAPATLALLEQRCSDVSMDLSRLDSKLQATSDVSQLRRSAMLHVASICTHLRALLDGAADPALEVWGKLLKRSKFTVAFERVMHEFRCATYSMECPQVSREKVANILLAHAGRGGSSGMTEAAAEIARAAARLWLAPLTETTCDRLAFVLQSLFDLAMERSRTDDSRCYDDLAVARA
ncbi:Dynamin-like protein C [Hordeum vulgare]|nr:Dynamin-like protein C [Hordeum vulgare]